MSQSMVTIGTYWVACSYLLGFALAFDQLRRPRSQWEAAGRSRGFWLALSVATSLHGLGQYAAVAYLVGVVPRFRGGERATVRGTIERWSATIAAAWRTRTQPRPHEALDGRDETARDFAVVAATLIFAASFIHALVIADHFEEYWLSGAFFAVVTIWQALWTGTVYGGNRSRRVLVSGAIGNAALVAVWAVSRTVGAPFGPQRFEPQPAGALDVLCVLDEVAAVILIVAVLTGFCERRLALSPALRTLSAALAGPLFIFSVMAPFAGLHTH